MNRRILLFPLILIFTYTLNFCGCEKEEKSYKKVRLNTKQTRENYVATKPEKIPLRIAIAPVISPIESFKVYNDLIEYIANKLGRSGVFIQGSNYAEINNLIRYDHCDVAFVCDYAYLQGQKDFGMEILVVPQVNGKAMYQSYIIVSGNSTAKSFWHLEGKSFAFADPLSSSGYLYPKYLLKKNGKTPETFFKKTIFTFGHDNSIKAVSQGLIDGAAVDSLVYDFMVARKKMYKIKTKVIDRSPFWPSPPIVVNPKMDPQTRLMLRNVFLSMHEDKEGKLILEKLMIDKFVLQEDKAYNSVREMARKVGY